VQHLFQSWESFSAGIRAASHVLFLSDYDGTLTPIVGRPDQAVLLPDTREKLRALAEKPAFSVGIISGRSLAELKSMVGIGGIYYGGNHGLEIEGPGLNYTNPAAEAAGEMVRELTRQLFDGLGGIEGVIIEDKGLSLSLHYRLVGKEMEWQVADIFHQITAPWLNDGKIRITSGKKVWEVKPPIDWHKGKAVEVIVREIKDLPGLEQLLTIYLGDDTTDEDAFKVVRRPQGWSVFVGGESPESNADYFLVTTAEVEEFLYRLPGLKR